MPISVIKPQLRNLRRDVLPDLKREWGGGVSMAALVERAFRSGLITPAQRTSFYKYFGAMGWRTREAVSDELPPEVPRLTQVIADSLMQRGLSPREIADIAGFATAQENRLLRPGGLRAVYCDARPRQGPRRGSAITLLGLTSPSSSVMSRDGWRWSAWIQSRYCIPTPV